MSTEAKTSVIHRKAMGARNEFDARVMSPAKALRLGLAKTADKMFGLALTVTTVEQVVLPHAKVQSEAGNDGLLLLLDGGAGARGAAKVDQQFLMALIEVQTMGTVRRAAAEDRIVTRTDAAIVAPLLDSVLRQYDAQLAEAAPEYLAQEYRFGDMIEDARTLSLALEAPEFDLFRLSLDIEEGAKTGTLTILLPKQAQHQKSDANKNTKSPTEISLKKNALEAQAVLDAVLPRITMPLKSVCDLKPGMVLELESDCLTKVQVVGPGGHDVGRVKMGQMNGMRAVRFVAAPGSGAAPEAESDRPDDVSKPSLPRNVIESAVDDVLEGVATPVADLDGNNAPPDLSAEDQAALDEMTANAEAEMAEALSAADLMMAASPAQSQPEDA